MSPAPGESDIRCRLMGKVWHRIWHDGPMMFVYGVVVWFLAGAFDLGQRIPTFEAMKTSSEQRVNEFGAVDAAPNDEPTITQTSTGALDITVTSLRARPDGDRMMVTVTLEIDNTSKNNVSFEPKALVLHSANGAQVTAVRGPKTAMTIGPRYPQLTPLTFSLPASARAPFELQYNGQPLFSGYSI